MLEMKQKKYVVKWTVSLKTSKKSMRKIKNRPNWSYKNCKIASKSSNLIFNNSQKYKQANNLPSNNLKQTPKPPPKQKDTNT